MSLLGDAVQDGIHLPAPLLIFRKAVFTLDGVANDVAGDVNVSSILARYVLKHRLSAGAAVWSLLSTRDMLALEWRA